MGRDGGSASASGHERSETDEDRDERLNRELIELLNELRVALPGIQVLFAFLLTVAFSQKFGSLGDGGRALYFAAFVCTAIASILFMAPTSYHRIQFRQRDKERMLRTSNLLAIVGTVFLAAAITCVTALITDILFGRAVALGVSAAVVGLVLWLWYAIPISRRLLDDDAV